jgi:hypothetical protein
MNSRTFLARALAFALLVSSLALAQTAAPTRTVIRPVLNMHSSATLDADVVSQAIYATLVVVLEEKGGWARIRTPDEYTGWVESAALLASKSGEVYASGTNVVQVRSLFAHIYREADVTRHAPMLTLPFETKLEMDGENAKKSERWLQVRLPDGRIGMVQNGDVGPIVAGLAVVETIAVAKSFLGLPYTWGGTSSYGYDCSGFMQMLMRQRGYLMPRDAGPQAAWGGSVSVDKSRLEPGDLLYFGSSPARITHTGMYIGDGLFISATTHKKPVVRIDNLNDAYWTRLLVAARRVRQ